MMARLEAMIQNNQDRLEVWMNAINEKFEVFHSVLISWMEIHQARTETSQEEIIVQMDIHWERIGASVKAWKRDSSLQRSYGHLSGE
jgi:hypothetical protein